jgi:S-DNA-T family DNA segregation ATPase FtsK/SpoIIIE
MASYQARQRDPLLDQGTQAMLERRGRELLGLVLVLVAFGFVADAVELFARRPRLDGRDG